MPSGSPHPHEHVYLVCHRCGTVTTLPVGELDELVGRWRDRYGFNLHPTQALPGRCAACADGGVREKYNT